MTLHAKNYDNRPVFRGVIQKNGMFLRYGVISFVLLTMIDSLCTM